MTYERITLIDHNAFTSAPLSPWQRERASGELLPMEEHEATMHVASWEVWAIAIMFLIAVPALVGAWWFS